MKPWATARQARHTGGPDMPPTRHPIWRVYLQMNIEQISMRMPQVTELDTAVDDVIAVASGTTTSSHGWRLDRPTTSPYRGPRPVAVLQKARSTTLLPRSSPTSSTTAPVLSSSTPQAHGHTPFDRSR